jgi:hypothetical protein
MNLGLSILAGATSLTLYIPGSFSLSWCLSKEWTF